MRKDVQVRALGTSFIRGRGLKVDQDSGFGVRNAGF